MYNNVYQIGGKHYTDAMLWEGKRRRGAIGPMMGAVVATSPTPKATTLPKEKGQAVIFADKPVAELPSKTVIPHDPVPDGGNTGGDASGGNTGGNEVEETETKSSELGTLRGDAYQHMLDLINKKFSYNSKSSPLYGILREQYEREAERASGRAYARATANAGGYGSSYATLAGEEAARQVMEGFDDNQMALYEAARDEFYSEQQSAVERYQLLDQMYKEQKALEEEEAAELARSAAGGLTDTQYKAYTAAAQVWNGENKESVKAQLSRMPGMTAADVEAVMSALEADDDAVLADNVNSFKNAPTLSGAASLLATAKGRDNEAEITAEVQGTMKDAFTAALEDPTSAEVFSLLGMTEEQAAEKFGGITDPDELASAMKAEALNAAGQARKNGLLSGEDFMNLLKNDVGADLKVINDKDDEVENPMAAVADIGITMQNYHDAGYLTDDEYSQMLDQIMEKTDISGIWARESDELYAEANAEINGEKEFLEILGQEILGSVLSFGMTSGIGGLKTNIYLKSRLDVEDMEVVEKVGSDIIGWSSDIEKNRVTLSLLGCISQIPGASLLLDRVTGSQERTSAIQELGLHAYHSLTEEMQNKLRDSINNTFGGK